MPRVRTPARGRQSVRLDRELSGPATVLDDDAPRAVAADGRHPRAVVRDHAVAVDLAVVAADRSELVARHLGAALDAVDVRSAERDVAGGRSEEHTSELQSR